jgi:Family of unknown function (DUF6167)
VMSRAIWFAVGTGAGVYGTFKARRVVYRLSPEGLADQAGALGLGLRTLAADIRAGTAEREAELLARLGLQPAAEQQAAAPALAASPQNVRRDIP